MTSSSANIQQAPASSPGQAPQQADGDDKVHELNPKAQRRFLTARVLFLYVLPALIVAAGAAWFIIGSAYVSTENAYTKSEIAAINALVSGPIEEIFPSENEDVAAGDLLFRLDRVPFEIRLAETQAALEKQRREIETLKAGYREKLISLKVAKADAAYAERDYQRQSELASTRVVSEARLDRARHDAIVAQQRVTIVTQDLKGLLVSLAGDPDLPVGTHPSVIEAQAKVDRAVLDLERTEVRAPFDGIASNVPKKGDYIRAGFPAMSVVATNDIWIEANFKETQLTHVEAGQRVIIKVDAYPGWEWQGWVESIASATGGEFSILPAQNTTGNWVKVVQRIPIRIRIEPKGDEPLLRAGFSTHVSIDTGERRGAFSPRKEARSVPDPAE